MSNKQKTVKQVGTSPSNISQHLSSMQDKGILSSSKVTDCGFYRITDNRIAELIKLMKYVFCSNNDYFLTHSFQSKTL